MRGSVEVVRWLRAKGQAVGDTVDTSVVIRQPLDESPPTTPAKKFFPWSALMQLKLTPSGI